MIDCVLAGVLGAVLLALALLTKGYRENRVAITQLRAEITAQKIAALPGVGQTPGADPTPGSPPAKQCTRLSSLRPSDGVTALRLLATGRGRHASKPHAAAAATGHDATGCAEPAAAQEEPTTPSDSAGTPEEKGRQKHPYGQTPVAPADASSAEHPGPAAKPPEDPVANERPAAETQSAASNCTVPRRCYLTVVE